MSKVKYYYDKESLSYRKIERKKRTTFKYAGIFILAAAFFAFIFIFIASQYVESPKERAFKRELQNAQLQFDLLNKKMEHAEAVLANVADRDNNIYRTYFEADPISNDVRKAGFGGVNRYKALDGFDNSEMIKGLTKNVDILSKQIAVQSQSLDEIVSLAKEKEKMFYTC